MNMLTAMLKNLLPREGDFRLTWSPGPVPNSNNVYFTLWEISEDGDNARKVVNGYLEWPK